MSHLKRLLAQHGIKQTDLARIFGRDKSVITNLFQGKRQLKAEEAMQIAKLIGVPVSQILGISEQAGGFSEPPLLIPFQHEPKHWKRNSSVVKKEGKFYLGLEEQVAYSPKAYAMEVQDDSMNLSGVIEGDFVISELDRACNPGQLVIAQLYQGRGAKTVIRKYEPPFLLPHSTSPAFKPVNTEQQEVRLVSPVLKLIRAY